MFLYPSLQAISLGVRRTSKLRGSSWSTPWRFRAAVQAFKLMACNLKHLSRGLRRILSHAGSFFPEIPQRGCAAAIPDPRPSAWTTTWALTTDKRPHRRLPGLKQAHRTAAWLISSAPTYYPSTRRGNQALDRQTSRPVIARSGSRSLPVCEVARESSRSLMAATSPACDVGHAPAHGAEWQVSKFAYRFSGIR